MRQFLFNRLGQSVVGGAVIIAVFSVISRILGLLRDRLLAARFGADVVTDSYYAAFRLPDFVFQTLVLGALTSAFIPVFVRLYQKQKEDGFALANGTMTILMVVMGLLAAAVAIGAPLLTKVIAPGFSTDQQQLTTQMTRIMLGGILLFSVSNVAGGVLQGLRRFLAFSLSPLFYNLGLIFGIIFLVNWWGPIGLAWGVVVGAAAHLIIQLTAAYMAGWRPRWRWSWSDQFINQVWKLMLPRTFGLAAAQVNQVVITVIASALAVGSLTQLTWADNLQNVPINVFGVPLAVATFPVLAQQLASNDTNLFLDTVRNNLRRILFLVMPAAALIVVLRAQIIRVVLGSGAFDWADTYHTAQILGILAAALVANSLIALLARVFYAQEDTKTPVRLALLGVVVNIILAVILSKWWGIEGVAAATSTAAVIQLGGLLISLHRRWQNFFNKALWRSWRLIIINSLMAMVITRVVLEITQPLLAQATFWGVLGQGLAAGGIGLAAYISLGLLTDCEDVVLLRKLWAKYTAPFKRLWIRSN